MVKRTRITKLTEGFDFIGFTFVKRRSPNTGKNVIYIFPRKASRRSIRRRIKYFTKRRAPVAPDKFVAQINEAVQGWVNYYRHPNASDAFRRLQRFSNIRFRRYLTFRSKGRGYGISEYYRPIPTIDHWLRRRVRMCYWKQWCKVRTRIKNLLKIGTKPGVAIPICQTRKCPWKCARTLATQTGMTNQWLKDQALVFVKEQWVKIHYPATAR
jgi:hypothetical protein